MAESVSPANDTSVQSPRSRNAGWPWWKILLASLGGLVILLALFHRPLIFGVAKFAAGKVGASQGLSIQFEPSGSIFTGLTLRNVRVSPTRPGPVEKANIGLLQVSYNLVQLIRGGMASAWLGELTLHEADIVYDPSKSPPSPPKAKEPFKLPALPLPRDISLEHVNILLRGAASPVKAEAEGQAAAASSAVPAPAAPAVKGATKAVVDEGLLIAGLNLELHPDRPGILHFGEVRIPGGPELKNVTAGTTYRDRDLRITDLTLAPQLHFRLLELDASRLAQERLGLSFDADLFAGRGSARIGLEGLGVSPKCDVDLKLDALALRQLSDFLKLDTPLAGQVRSFSVNFRGIADQPRTWNGKISADLGELIYGAGTAHLDEVTARILLQGGTADILQLQLTQGANKISFTAKAELPAQLDALPQTTARGTLQADLPNLANLPVEVPAGVSGAVTTHGDFTVADGFFKANLTGSASNVHAADASVGKSEFSLELSKRLPPTLSAASPPAAAPTPTPKTSSQPVQADDADGNEEDDFRWVANPVSGSRPTPSPTPLPARSPAPVDAAPKTDLTALLDGLKTNLNATVTDVRYGDYLIDSSRINIRTDGDQVDIQQIDIRRGDNRIQLHGNYQLPSDPADWRNHPLALDLDVQAPDLAQFNAPKAANPLKGQLDAKGQLALKDGHFQGGFDVTGRNLAAKGAQVQSIDTHIDVQNDVATISRGDIQFDEKNRIHAGGEINLGPPYTYSSDVDITLSDLARFEPALRAAGLKQPLAGSVHITGKSSGRLAADDRLLNGNFDVTGTDIRAAGARIASVDAHLVLDRDKAIVQNGVIRFDDQNVVGFDLNATLNGTQPFQVRVTADLPNLAAFEPALRANGVSSSIGGAFRLEARVSGTLAAPAPPPGHPPATALRIDDGNVVLTGTNLSALKTRVVEQLEGRVALADNRARIESFNLRFDDKNSVALGGEAGLAAPYPYQGKLDADLASLRTFQPLLRQLKPATPPPGTAPAQPAEPAVKRKSTPVPNSPGKSAPGDNASAPQETRLAGSVQLHWQGEGRFGPSADASTPDAPASPVPPPLVTSSSSVLPSAAQTHTGSATVTARGVEYNALGPVSADVAGSYSPDEVNVPTLLISLNGLELRGTIAAKDGIARLDNLHLRQGQTDLLAGYAQIPLNFNKPADSAVPVPDSEAIDVNIDSKPIPLQTLYGALFPGKTAPASGTIALTVLAKGRLSKMDADLKLQARTLRSPKEPKLAPADADLNLILRDDRLNLDVSVRQPQLAPITIKGNVPLNLETVLNKRALDPNSPVQLVVDLPPSQLGFIKNLVPAIRFISGTARANVQVNGTIQNPVLSGSAELNVPAARAENITVPAIRNLDARLVFNDRTLRIDRFNIEVGGGKATANGRIDFATLTAPTFDLSARADSVLVLRDDSITARVNADVRVAGPLAGATVSGRVGVTKSRFLKDIDILPLNLPGRPAPAPPAVAQAGYGPEALGINAPLLRDWKLDLSIKTDDPFFVRGNLANGRALVDLQLAGTAGKPLLSGYVQLENLTATLPFSRLEIQNGNIQFTPDQPLNPVLEMRGTSQIRERLVTVFISGRARDPKTQFTSEPPLPQADIVSLLATGATPSELAGNSQALAGKATLLVLQDLYRRTFKKRGASRNAEPQATLADRIDLNLGNVDPKTGKQSVGATFRINEQYRFIGDFGVEGDIRGRIKYLLRFR